MSLFIRGKTVENGNVEAIGHRNYIKEGKDKRADREKRGEWMYRKNEGTERGQRKKGMNREQKELHEGRKKERTERGKRGEWTFRKNEGTGRGRGTMGMKDWTGKCRGAGYEGRLWGS